jgi:molybdate transport repressor ModE-like protein
LRRVDEHGTLVAAARALAIPYRTAWSLLENAAQTLQAPLLHPARGRGATLAPLARRWIAADDEAQKLLATRVASIDVEAKRGAAPPHQLRVAASHDIALAQLRDGWRDEAAVALEFHGSSDSLAHYRAQRADVAGFHVGVDAAFDDPLLARLDPAADALVRFLTREQGLILARGNPKRVRVLADLASKRLSIVNRQPGSGSRLLFDRLLAAERIDATALDGYSTEEFTHAAVAATVASGRAEAGFGVRAAAAQLGLAFVPLAIERYLFACRSRLVDSPRMLRFRELLASAATREVVAALPGYALDAPGALLARPLAPRRRATR